MKCLWVQEKQIMQLMVVNKHLQIIKFYSCRSSGQWFLSLYVCSASTKIFYLKTIFICNLSYDLFQILKLFPIKLNRCQIYSLYVPFYVAMTWLRLHDDSYLDRLKIDWRWRHPFFRVGPYRIDFKMKIDSLWTTLKETHDQIRLRQLFS